MTTRPQIPARCTRSGGRAEVGAGSEAQPSAGMAGMIHDTPGGSMAAGSILGPSIPSVCLCTTISTPCLWLLSPGVQPMEQTQPLLPTVHLALPLPLHFPLQRTPLLLPLPHCSARLPCALFLRKEQLLLLPGNSRVGFTLAHKEPNGSPLSQVARQGNPPCLSPTCPFSSGCPHQRGMG